MNLKALLDGFSSGLGIGEAEADGDGVFRFAIDGVKVAFMEIVETGSFVIWASVGRPPEDVRLYRELLEAMFMGEGTGGATFSLDRVSGNLILQRIDSVDAFDVDSFTALIERFVGVLEKWRGCISDFAIAAPILKKAEEQAREAERDCWTDGFLRA